MKQHLKKISKAEMLWLMSNGYIDNYRGRYINLYVTSKQHTKKKTRFVTDELADFVRNKNIV